jgi:hypothetical protein
LQPFFVSSRLIWRLETNISSEGTNDERFEGVEDRGKLDYLFMMGVSLNF